MLLIAHRGDTVNFPENSIEAFQSAIEKGADGIEMDVQVDRQGNAIIVHDYIHPETDTYPTLIQILEHFHNTTHLEIEIKSYRLAEVDTIIRILRNFNPRNIELTSSIYPILTYVHQILPTWETGAIFPDKYIESWMTAGFITDYFDGYMQLTHAQGIHLPPSFYDASVIAALKKSYTIHHHIKTANTKDYERLKALGVDCVTFDDIRLLTALSVRKGI